MFSEPRAFFHESYFEHPCKVVTERDVLQTDIQGNDWKACLRRSWYNTFLLTYSDTRCRDYYSSSQAMRQERARQFRLYPSSIHPFSKFSAHWNTFILLVSVANRFIFHYNTSLPYGHMRTNIIGFSMIFEAILIIDLFVVLKTGFLDTENRKVELCAKKCLIHYCSTKLFIHVASIMPLQGLMMVRYYGEKDCVFCRGNMFGCCVQMLGALGLFRVYDVLRTWDRDRQTFSLTYFFRLLRILILASITLLQYINFKNAIYLYIMLTTQKINEESSFHKAMELRQNVKSGPMFFISMQFSIVCKYLFSYGMIGDTTDYYHLNAITGIIGFVLANAFKLWGFVEWYTIMNRQKSRADVRSLHRNMTMNYLRTKQVSDVCSAKIDDYYDYVMTNVKVVETANDLYQVLPTTILREIKLNNYFRFIKRIPYFQDWPIEMVEDITLLLREEIYLQQDVVAEKWMQGNGLMILFSGILAVYSSQGEEVGHLIDGDYFGELSLVTDREIRVSNVIAVHPSKILFLSKNSFRRYMHRHPELFFELRTHLRDKFYKDHADNDSGTENTGEDDKKQSVLSKDVGRRLKTPKNRAQSGERSITRSS